MRKNTLLLNADKDASGGGGGDKSALGSAQTATDWRTGIPEDIRGDAALASFKDVGSLAKSYLHAQKLVGSDKIAKPTDKWTPEQWNAFYNDIGRPDSADKYPDSDVKLPDGVELDKESVAQAKKYLHDQGLTAKQAKAVLDYHYNLLGREHASEIESGKQRAAAALDTLKKEWGTNTDMNIGLAKAVVQQHGGAELLKELEASGMANSPAVIKFLHKISKLTAEDLSVGGGPKSFLPTAEAAKQSYNDLIGDKDFMAALNDAGNPGHASAMDKWRKVIASLP